MRTHCEIQIQVKNTDHSLRQRKSMHGAITGDIIGLHGIVVGPEIVGARSADGRARGPNAQAGDVLLRVEELD